MFSLEKHKPQDEEMFAACWMLEGRVRKRRRKAEGEEKQPASQALLLCHACLCF